MTQRKIEKVAKIVVVLFVISLPVSMILAYDGNRIALTYCNGLSAFSGIVLNGLQKMFAGLESAIASAMQ